METGGEPSWVALKDEELLNVRICDLGVRIEGSELEPRVRQFHDELAARGVTFRPDCYLGDEWFSPEGVPAIAIPFYLAHPRLKTLELHQMLEVEGGTAEWCQMLLRHECGHAIDHAYRFSSRKDWQQHLRQPRDRVHAGNLQAASVQQELRPAPAELVRAGASGRGFRRDVRGVAGGRAGRVAATISRLEGAGETGIRPHADAGGRGQAAAGQARTPDLRGEQASQDAWPSTTPTRRKLYAEDFPDFYDADLRAIFGNGEPGGESAAHIMRKHRAALIAVDRAMDRAAQVHRQHAGAETDSALPGAEAAGAADPVRLHFELAAYLATLVTNHLYTGRFKRSV